jgi:hypothetical protein
VIRTSFWDLAVFALCSCPGVKPSTQKRQYSSRRRNPGRASMLHSAQPGNVAITVSITNAPELSMAHAAMSYIPAPIETIYQDGVGTFLEVYPLRGQFLFDYGTWVKLTGEKNLGKRRLLRCSTILRLSVKFFNSGKVSVLSCPHTDCSPLSDQEDKENVAPQHRALKRSYAVAGK